MLGFFDILTVDHSEMCFVWVGKCCIIIYNKVCVEIFLSVFAFVEFVHEVMVDVA